MILLRCETDRQRSGTPPAPRFRPLTNPVIFGGVCLVFRFLSVLFRVLIGLPASSCGGAVLGGHCQGDFLDVLCGGGEQALGCDGGQAPEAGISMSMKLLGVGEGTFDGFLSPLVDGLTPIGQAVGVGSLAGVLPDMAGNPRVALALEVRDASNGQDRQAAGSLL